jgi:anti-sigma B factor antagonist
MLNSGQCAFRQIEPDVTVMDFTGRFTTPEIMVASVERAIKRRIEGGCRKLVLDLTKVDFVDSAGVGMLAVCSGAMEQAGGTIVIVGATGHVKKVLEIVHLERTIRMFSDVASACKALAEASTRPATA